VHEPGIEISLKCQKATRSMILTTTNKELQQLIRKIKFVRRSISNLSRQLEPFMSLVKIKSDSEFNWGTKPAKGI
jgi:archaellum component FlaC